MSNATWWVVGILLVLYVLIPVFLWLVTPPPLTEADLHRRKRAIVLVLGDLGRSPRMNYHALSLADSGLDVDLCGYTESKLMDAITENERITVRPVPQVLNTMKLPFILFAIRKVILQHWYLYKMLKQLKGAEFLVVQNPPSIPVLGMSRFFVLFMSQRTRLVIDWHNFGYSILAIKLGNKHPFVILYKWYEMIFGRIAFCHFTVTVAMAKFLQTEFKMTARRIVPLHDRPPEQFHPLSASEQNKVMDKHPELFGNMQSNEKVIITSTSYTPDENLYTLLEALDRYDSSSQSLCPLRVIITGKGPMFQEMRKVISSKDYKRVCLKQCWLASEDYPLVLGCADIGVSLHYSSSGIDLPMKVVDMFGCGVPVVALGFEAIGELIDMNTNGVIVKDGVTMADALISIISNPAFFDNIKRGALKEAQNKWENNWNSKVGPLFGRGEYENGRAFSDDSSSSSSDSEIE